MKKFAMLAALAGIILVVSSCELIGLGPGIALHNNSGYAINKVFVNDHSSSTWGANRLTADLASGDTQNFFQMSTSIDIRVDIGNYYWQLYGIEPEGLSYKDVYLGDSDSDNYIDLYYLNNLGDVRTIPRQELSAPADKKDNS